MADTALPLITDDEVRTLASDAGVTCGARDAGLVYLLVYRDAGVLRDALARGTERVHVAHITRAHFLASWPDAALRGWLAAAPVDATGVMVLLDADAAGHMRIVTFAAFGCA